MNIQKKNRNFGSPNKSDAYYKWMLYGTVTLHGILNPNPVKDKVRQFYPVFIGNKLAYWKPDDDTLYIYI